MRKRGLEYAVAVASTTKVWKLDSLDRRIGGRTFSVRDYAAELANQGAFRTTDWHAANRRLSSRFVARRVLPIADEGHPRAEREVVWLLVEWEKNEKAPNKFALITAPEDVTKKDLVYAVKSRWRTERVYQDMKDQLGLDHFEGRRFRGWHHHVTVVLACYAFVAAERARHFPPSVLYQQDIANRCQTRAPLLPFLHHRPDHRGACDCQNLATEMPSLSSSKAERLPEMSNDAECLRTDQESTC